MSVAEMQRRLVHLGAYRGTVPRNSVRAALGLPDYVDGPYGPRTRVEVVRAFVRERMPALSPGRFWCVEYVSAGVFRVAVHGRDGHRIAQELSPMVELRTETVLVMARRLARRVEWAVSNGPAVVLPETPRRGMTWSLDYLGPRVWRVELRDKRGVPVLTTAAHVGPGETLPGSVAAATRLLRRMFEGREERRKLRAGGRVRHFLKGHKITSRTVQFRSLPPRRVYECDCGKVWKSRA